MADIEAGKRSVERFSAITQKVLELDPVEMSFMLKEISLNLKMTSSEFENHNPDAANAANAVSEAFSSVADLMMQINLAMGWEDVVLNVQAALEAKIAEAA